MISLIVVAYNEAMCIGRTLRYLEQMTYEGKREIIVADGGSSDATVGISMKYAQVVEGCKGRAKQQNLAAQSAEGDILWFLHADMRPHPYALEAIHQYVYEEGYDGGGFPRVFDEYHERINHLRTRLNFRTKDKQEQVDCDCFCGENGIFVRKNVFEALGGFCDMPIMEDYEFTERLQAQYKIKKICSHPLVISARRYVKEGFMTTCFRWMLMKKLYQWGVSPERLATWYRDVR